MNTDGEIRRMTPEEAERLNQLPGNDYVLLEPEQAKLMRAIPKGERAKAHPHLKAGGKLKLLGGRLNLTI